MRFARAFRKTNQSNFKAIAGRIGEQTINRPCKIRTFTYIEAVLNGKLDLNGSVLIVSNMF